MMDTIGFLGCGNMVEPSPVPFAKLLTLRKFFWQTALRPSTGTGQRTGLQNSHQCRGGR